MKLFGALPALLALAPAAVSALGLSDVAGRTRGEVREGVQCCTTGLVTFVSQWLDNSGIVALPDAPNGPGVWFSGEVGRETVATVQGADALKAGMLVEISGITSHLGFAPGLRASSIRVIGERELPPPPAHRLRDFDWGVMDNMRATMEGVLMDAANVADPNEARPFVRLQLLTPDGVFLAHAGGDVGKWLGLVDARLRLSGVAMSVFNIRGEFIGVQLEVPDGSDATVVEAAPDPASIALAPLSELLPYTPVAPDSHRRRVRGVLTLALDGRLVCLQSGNFSLWVKTGASGLSLGDEVEAVGFPLLENGMGTLVFAKVERLGHVGLPAPEKVGWAQLDGYPVRDDGSYENYDGRRVEMTGTLESLEEHGEGLCRIAFDVEGVRVEAEVRRPVPKELLGSASLHPRIRATGVLSLVHEAGLPVGRMAAIVERRLYVTSCDEIAVADDAALARFRRGKALAFGACAALAVGIGFVLFLLVRFLRYRADYRRLGILTEERKRMAGDLHDTVEQSLVAAKMLLKTAVSLSPDTPEEVKDAVATAQDILMDAKSTIRETVFNLRNDEFFGKKPEDVLKSMAARINSRGIVKVRTSLRGLPSLLPGARFSDILYIINEAVTNAVKHGRAKTIMLVSDPLVREAGANGFCLRVLNDGEPFDPATALGPESGHFGVAGMHERARRSDIGFSIGMEKGLVSVRLEVRE